MFDTLVTRCWAKPADLFYESGRLLREKGIIKITADAFQQARMEAEEDARKEATEGECTFEDIYNALGLKLGWSAEVKIHAMQIEEEMELRAVRPVKMLYPLISHLSPGNDKTDLLSDMYLPAETIQKLVHKAGYKEFKNVFVSGETKENKASGKAFSMIRKLNQIEEKTDWLHIGDNPGADIRMPQRQKIRTIHFDNVLLNRYENSIYSCTGMDLKDRSLLAAASRNVRLQSPWYFNNSHFDTIWATCADVVAPLLYNYVYWCLDQAMEKKINRLYFLSRDGQILHKIAQQIVSAYKLPVHCSYLYASRHSWHFPAILEINDEVLSWVFDNTQILTLRIIFERVRLQEKDIQDFQSRQNLLQILPDKNLNTYERNLVKQKFSSDKEIANKIIFNAQQERNLFIRYLEQQQVLKDKHFAVVDIGWNGRLQRSLSRVLHSRSGEWKGITGFYFGLYNKFKAFEGDELNSYLESNLLQDLKFRFNEGILETFVTADHGSVSGFYLDEMGHSVHAKLAFEVNKRCINWGLFIQQEAIISYSKYLTETYWSFEDYPGLKFINSVVENLKQFQNDPSDKEANCYGSFVHSEQQTESVMTEIAPHYSFLDAMGYFLTGKRKFHVEWRAAVLKRTDSVSAILIRIKERGIRRILRF